MKQKISFIIVAYKPDKKILDALISALSDWDVRVVDNTKYNRGYGGGANVGFGEALQKRTNWIVLVNQDVRITKEGVISFVDALVEAPAGIAGSVIGSLDPKRWTTILGGLPQGELYVSGSWFAIHRDILEKIGDFYEPYFLYYEEVDLCMRAKLAGYEIQWIPIKGMQHEESVGLGRGSFLHQYYLARNHLLFVERQAPADVKLHEFFRFPKTLFEHISRREWGALLGIFHYSIQRFGPLKEAQ